MRKMYWSLGLSLMMLCGIPTHAEEAAGVSERSKKLEGLLEVAVDRFQLNRFIEARAALNRLIAENPTDEEAFKLRKLFGEKILLEMQRFGNRPVLSDVERKVLQMLSEASFALDRFNPEKAADRLEQVVKIYKDAKYSQDSFAVKHAEEMAEAVKKLNKDSAEEVREYTNKLTMWREQLQSVGNVPLVLLSRAQRFEQDKLHSPEQVRAIVSRALEGADSAQRNMLEIVRLGSHAVPQLLEALRNDKDDARRTNAHFILMTLGNRVLLPLCEALKANDQLFLQQVCSLIGEIRPADKRAVPYLKAIYDNRKNLDSTVAAAGSALREVTGGAPDSLMPAADYFLQEANRYYMGGDDVDQEIRDMNNTIWVWDQDKNGGKGLLCEVPVPAFVYSEMVAEELVYRGMATAADKTPFQVLLASIFLQQKNKVDTINKLLAREDLSHPDSDKLRSDALDWKKRLARNQRIVFTLGAKHMVGVVEKALRDQKAEVAISALESLAVVVGERGWNSVSSYVTTDKNGKTSVNPLLAALDNENPRVAVTAANTLVSLGLPTSHPDYVKLLPLLLNGTQENRSTVIEVITGDNDLRHRLADDLEKGQMVPQVSADGYAGYNLAVQYPPKDVILLDNRLDQFNVLRLQLALRGISQNRVLPLTIITTKDHVNNIAAQFAKDEVEKEAAKKHISAEMMLNSENNRFETGSWRVVTFHGRNKLGVTSEEKNIFEHLQNVMRNDQRQAVVILTQPSREERYKLKEFLQLKAERSLRPGSLSTYAALREKDKVLGDIFGVRVTYTPVFVDEEIAGYDTMATVQALLTDPRTRAVPLGIMADPADMKNVRADFESFIKDGILEIIPRDIPGNELLAKVGEMKKKNVLSEKNYARALSNDIATRSAQALLKLSPASIGRKLTPAEEKMLYSVVADVGRPEKLRLAAAETLGHFQAATVLKSLMTLFLETDKENVALRAAMIRAIGEIDTTNAEIDFKLAAMGESAPEIQKEAARALGPAAQNQEQLRKYMENLRPNDPLALARGVKAAGTEEASNAEKAEEKKEDDAPAAEEKKEEKTENAEDSEKKTEKKDDKKEEEFNW